MDGDSLITTTSSHASVHSTNRPSPEKILTINKQTKIEKESAKSQNYCHRPSVNVVVIKWVSTVILGLLLLGCLVASKLSMLTLSATLKNATNITSPGYQYDLSKKPNVFVMLLWIVLAPNIINLLRGLWAGAFRSDLPWPGKKSLFVGFIISLTESVGIALFVFKIPAITKISDVVLLMNSVFLIPLLYYIVHIQKTRSTDKCFFAIALLLELVGVGITGYLIYKSFSIEKAWVIPVAIICISISWTPEVQRCLLEGRQHGNGTTEYTEFDRGGHDDELHRVGQSGNDSTEYQNQREIEQDSSIITIPLNQRPKYDEHTVKQKQLLQERTTWKLTIYMSFLKIILIFGLSLICFFVPFDDREIKYNTSDFKNGWNWHKTERTEIALFLTNIITSLMGYLIGYIACTTCMQRWAFSIPLTLSTPISVTILLVSESCKYLDRDENCKLDVTALLLCVVATLFLVGAQAFSTGRLLFRSQSIVMLKESQLFWVPMYNGALLEQWLMLIRRNEHSDECYEDPIEKAKHSKVIICTTMYREADYEMRQLLESIQGINLAQSVGGRHFESHIFFDGAVKDKNPTDFVLQLVSLVESTLGVRAEHCSKTMTPYGMSLGWELNVPNGKKGMILRIHLKDNFKVKNKKRWSQVMYMSYVLDFLMVQMDHATDEDCYILTTDADVRFTPDSVEALLDLMTRDTSVGAVCARTHPLGSGPLVWYQVFEYAVGHWFQKAAEHVLGSVLCSPGCFSVYRCKAIRDILPQYATNVEHAFEFLTKDMGEDRWFCTLMVQSGWRIEYCAASENSTHCPEHFEEFFKQRRRWVASTLANLMLLIKEWNIIAKLNHRVSVVFLVYQAILLFATLIGPSSVILVVSGGLQYGWNVSSATSMVMQIVACVAYTITCLFTSSKTQLNTAKFLTFVYAVLMTSVVVGTAVQVVSDFTKQESSKSSFISHNMPVSTTTVYLGVMITLFIITGLLHTGEIVFLLHGIWFLLCLPAGYLILMIYSICNITDSSWGTREVKTHSIRTQRQNWQDILRHAFKSVFFCCFRQDVEKKEAAVQTEVVTVKRRISDAQDGMVAQENDNQLKRDRPVTQLMQISEETPDTDKVDAATNDEDDESDTDCVSGTKVGTWLPYDMKHLAERFIQHGFENTMLISGMTERELKDLDIKGKGMKRYIMEEIKRLPDYEIPADVPENVNAWLDGIGLPQYKENFKKEQIKSAKDMEILKSFGRSEIEQELKITKVGHVKRLLYAIRKLRNPTPTERKILDVRKSIRDATLHHLKTVNVEEYEFWDSLKNACLLPQSTAYGLEEDLKVKLVELRNSWLMVFAVSNTLWLILIFTLANKGNVLSVFGSNPIGLVILVLFSFVLIIQFFAMVVHRVSTLIHFLGRAPYKFGATFNTAWAFNDSDMQTLDDLDAIRARQEIRNRAYQKIRRKIRASPKTDPGERTKLLSTSRSAAI